MVEYQCNICNETDELDADWAADLAICSDCWFGYLTGDEKRAVAKRIKA